jgi:cytosine/adenosine deaminase-related metal-dependent hydrolase
VATDARHAQKMDLAIRAGRVCRNGDGAEIDVSGYLLLPGLINGHDHLEFGLFPRLSRGLYSNAREWAGDIYHTDASPIREHRAVPKPVRLVWGGIRNLLSGVTTVAHHNPYDEVTFGDRFPVRVIREFGWAHSIDFTPDLVERFAATPDAWPFIVHGAEGTDVTARSEIRQLEALAVLNDRTVIVHANAAGPDEIEILRARGCAIVWCPSSNLATYGRTLTHETIRSGIPIALGTDSSLTAEIDLIDEIRLAKEQCDLTAEEVYEMVTTKAAAVFRLRRCEGTLQVGGVADLVAVKDTGQTPAEAILDLHPEVVMVEGQVRLMSERFAAGAPLLKEEHFHRIVLERRGSWWIDADIPNLLRAATDAIGPECRLAGRLVSS